MRRNNLNLLLAKEQLLVHGLAAWGAHLHRYMAAGLLATLTDFGLYYLLTKVLGFWYLGSHLVSRSLGAAVCFLMNFYFTFSVKESAAVTMRLYRFAALYLASFLLSSCLVWSFVDGLGADSFVGKILAEGMVFLFNYSVMKYWVMRQTREASNERGS